MKKFFSDNFQIGLLGGGQLGRMLLQKAYDYNISIAVLDPSEEAPCKDICQDFTVGDFRDFDTVYNFGKDKDLVTIEFEDVNADALQKLEDEGVKVYPQPSVLKVIQDKGLQKQFYRKHDIPTSDFILVENKKEIEEKVSRFPVFQKLRTSGYDGYGVQSLPEKESVDKAFDAPSLIEEGVDLEKELSVIVARNDKGEVKHFPLVELSFNPEANMVEFLFSPADVSKDLEKKAYELADKVIRSFEMTGILAVEMFLSKEGELMVNEVAPRPHNSGHHTIEGNYVSQYEQHLRSVLNLPLGETEGRIPAVMVNLLGEKGHTGPAYYEGVEEVMDMKGVHIHLYGKTQVKPFRKMGHVTCIDEDIELAKATARKVKDVLKVVSWQSQEIKKD